MIRIRRSATPKVLREKGGAETSRICEAYKKGHREFEFDSGIYGHHEVKKSLLISQHNKCAYCESKITAVSFGDVEHYRPKAGFHQRSTLPIEKPGYYWLAYRWSNLLVSCQICNQRHKKNLFPLANESSRARSHRDSVKNEEPLLIDCTQTDPELFIGFREEIAFAISGDPKGETTIEDLGLNRVDLAEARRTTLFDMKRLYKLTKLLEEKLSSSSNEELRKQINIELLRYRRELKIMSSPQRAYTAMARAYLKASSGGSGSI